MPLDYWELQISRLGLEGTLIKHISTKPDFDDRLRTATTISISTTEEKFMYVDQSIVDQRVNYETDGWDDNVDKIIFVRSTLDIGTRDLVDSDKVKLENNREYRVEYSSTKSFFRSTYKKVGLKEIEKGLI